MLSPDDHARLWLRRARALADLLAASTAQPVLCDALAHAALHAYRMAAVCPPVAVQAYLNRG